LTELAHVLEQAGCTGDLIAERTPNDDPLASQPTLSRFENFINIRSLKNLRALFVDQFIASFATPPTHLTFNMDAVDDPTHGDQQLSLFHGYFDQYQYCPLLITCAETDPVRQGPLVCRRGVVYADGAECSVGQTVPTGGDVGDPRVADSSGTAAVPAAWRFALCVNESVISSWAGRKNVRGNGPRLCWLSL